MRKQSIQSGRKDAIHRQGVATILHRSIAENLQGYELISQRLMMVQVETSTDQLFIYQMYAPDSTYSDEENQMRSTNYSKTYQQFAT